MEQYKINQSGNHHKTQSKDTLLKKPQTMSLGRIGNKFPSNCH